jgi:hypothetical protein
MDLLSILIGVLGIVIGYFWGRGSERRAKARHLLLARKLESPTAAGFTYKNGEPVGLKHEMKAEAGGFSTTGADLQLKKTEEPPKGDDGWTIPERR